MRERLQSIGNPVGPEIKGALADIEELQIARPNDWLKIVVDIYDERTLAAVATYKSLLRLKEQSSNESRV
jgi:hypothetical protein